MTNAKSGKRESPGEDECIFSLDLNTVTDSLLTTVFGSEFHIEVQSQQVPKTISDILGYQRAARRWLRLTGKV